MHYDDLAHPAEPPTAPSERNPLHVYRTQSSRNSSSSTLIVARRDAHSLPTPDHPSLVVARFDLPFLKLLYQEVHEAPYDIVPYAVRTTQ